MSELPTGPAETADDEMHARPQGLMIRFAKLWLTGLVTTVLLGIGGAFAICPCGDGICGGDSCIPPETPHSCPADCGKPTEPTDVMNFHFDESAGASVFNDLSAANRAASCGGSACPKAGEIGLRGTPKHNNAKLALDFDGEDDCLTIADNPAHEMSLPLSMSVWMLPRQLPTVGAAMAMLSKYSARGNQREWILGIRADSAGVSRLAFWQSAAGTSASTTAVYSNRQLTASDLNRWMHVVIRITAAGEYQWWVNGTLDSQGLVASTSLFKGSASVRIGCVAHSTDSPDFLFRGKIDEIMVARAYITADDIANQYSWSVPIPPRLAYTATSSQVQFADHQIDPAALGERLRALNAERYNYYIRRTRACGHCDDYAAAKDVLAYLKANDIDTKIVFDFTPFWGSRPEESLSSLCALSVAPHIRWACAIGELAAQHPGRILGWNIDDLFAEHWGQGILCKFGQCYVPAATFPDRPGEGLNSFLNRRRMLEVCDELHRHDPALKVSGTIYCDGTTTNPRNTYNMTWLDRCPVGQEGCDWENAFVDYVKNTSATDLTVAEAARLRSCVSGVTLYTGPKEIQPPPPAPSGAAVINGCISVLRELQVTSPILRIDEGVYLTFDDPPINCSNGRRQFNVDESRRTLPDGFVMYTMLEPGDCADPNYDSSGIDDLVTYPTNEPYIDW